MLLRSNNPNKRPLPLTPNQIFTLAARILGQACIVQILINLIFFEEPLLKTKRHAWENRHDQSTVVGGDWSLQSTITKRFFGTVLFGIMCYVTLNSCISFFGIKMMCRVLIRDGLHDFSCSDECLM